MFGTVDENNNIILSGELAAGTYTFKYEDAEGNVVDIGTLNQTHGPSYTNQIPISTDLSGNTLANGALYTDKRWNSSGSQSTAAGYFVSGLIPAKLGDVVRIRWPGGGDPGYLQIKAFNSSRETIDTRYVSFSMMTTTSDAIYQAVTAAGSYNADLTNGVMEFTIATSGVNAWTSAMAYITVTLYGAPADCIVTVNEPIESGDSDSGGESESGGEIPLNLTLGKINTSTGAIESTENYVYSDMITIEDGKEYTITLENCSAGVKVCYYNASGTLMSASSSEIAIAGGDTNKIGSDSAVIPIIDGAASFRLRMYCWWYGSSYAESVELAKAGAKLTWALT